MAGSNGTRVLAAAAWLVLVSLLVSCGSTPQASEAPAGGTTSEPSPGDQNPLVGTWQRETHCREAVSALRGAGLGDWVPEFVAGNGFVPNVAAPDQIADPTHPCKGSVPRVHAHVFSAAGKFGSLDWKGDPVDDGTYEIVDDHTFAISKEFPEPVVFTYTIEGDTIRFDPEIPACSPTCFEAAWSVAVAYPGEEWHRVS